MSVKKQIQLEVTTTGNHCPIGETVGQKHLASKSTPVISCEGACIRGEIARQAANIVAKQPGFGRGCHGEVFTVPDSAIAKWFHATDKVILIDGCFLRCHGRVLENMLGRDRLVQFDALSHYKKYTDIFDPEEVPPEERQAVARSVAQWVLDCLAKDTQAKPSAPCTSSESGCCC